MKQMMKINKLATLKNKQFNKQLQLCEFYFNFPHLKFEGCYEITSQNK